MLTVTRTVYFCAAHRLYNPDWSDDQNFEVYGKCSNFGGHGHNYTLKVSVSGNFDKETGMVINVTKLRDILKNEIVEKYDHKNLNEVDDFKNTVPTMEVIALKISKNLEKPFLNEGIKLVKLELSESEKNTVTLELI